MSVRLWADRACCAGMTRKPSDFVSSLGPVSWCGRRGCRGDLIEACTVAQNSAVPGSRLLRVGRVGSGVDGGNRSRHASRSACRGGGRRTRSAAWLAGVSGRRAGFRAAWPLRAFVWGAGVRDRRDRLLRSLAGADAAGRRLRRFRVRAAAAATAQGQKRSDRCRAGRAPAAERASRCRSLARASSASGCGCCCSSGAALTRHASRRCNQLKAAIVTLDPPQRARLRSLRPAALAQQTGQTATAGAAAAARATDRAARTGAQRDSTASSTTSRERFARSYSNSPASAPSAPAKYSSRPPILTASAANPLSPPSPASAPSRPQAARPNATDSTAAATANSTGRST